MAEVASFDEIWTEFLGRIQRVVYCSMATVDRQDRPRSRMMHPVWELVDNAPIGWVISWPETHKAKHLARNPYVSLAYIHDRKKPLYVDCEATWIGDDAEQLRVWELHRSMPPPVGFDPEPHYGDITHRHFGLLKFLPWRVELGSLYDEPIVWRPAPVSMESLSGNRIP